MSVLIFWSFELALRRTNVRHLALFTLFAGLGILSHYGVYWLLGGLALILLWRQKPREWIRWWPSGLALTLLTILILVFIAWPQYQVLHAAYPPSPIFDVAALRLLYNNLTKMAHLFSDYGGRWSSAATTATWLFIIVFLLGLGVALRKARYRPVVALFFVPLLVSYLASKAGLYLWGMRYLLFISPMFYLLLGIGFSALAAVRLAKWIVPLVALGILLFNQTFVGWPNENRGEHLRPIVEQIQQTTAVEGNAVYVFYGARPAFEVYYDGDMERVKLGKWLRNRPLAQQMEDILPHFNTYRETWFVASHYDQAELMAITEQLDERCLRAVTLQESNALAVKYICESGLE
jgi:hypothetical protein